MNNQAHCFQCGTTVSYDTGFTITGGLGDSSQDRIWCQAHAPDTGKGYTLADLQAMKEENQIQRELARSAAEMLIIEHGGMDVLDYLQRKPR